MDISLVTHNQCQKIDRLVTLLPNVIEFDGTYVYKDEHEKGLLLYQIKPAGASIDISLHALDPHSKKYNKISYIKGHSDQYNRDYFYIEYLETARDERKKGYASLIMQKCIDIIKIAGYTQVNLLSYPNVCEFYQKAGFDYVKSIPCLYALPAMYKNI